MTSPRPPLHVIYSLSRFDSPPWQRGSADLGNLVSFKEVLPTRDDAESELVRMNALNGRHTLYRSVEVPVTPAIWVDLMEGQLTYRDWVSVTVEYRLQVPAMREHYPSRSDEWMKVLELTRSVPGYSGGLEELEARATDEYWYGLGSAKLYPRGRRRLRTS